jgi:chromate transporter
MNRPPRAKKMFRNAREQGHRFGNRVRYGTKRLKRLSREQTLSGILLSFLKVGITGFGGGLAVMTQIRTLAVNKRRWFTDHEFAEAFALAKCRVLTPARGFLHRTAVARLAWAAAAMAGFILPSMLMMIGLAILYRHLHHLAAIQLLFHGLNAAVVALIAVTAWRIGRNTLVRPWQWYVAGLSTLAVTILSATIIEVVLAAGLIGIYIDSFAERRWYRWRRIRRLSARRRQRLLDQQAYFGGGYLTRALAEERVRRMQEEEEAGDKPNSKEPP